MKQFKINPLYQPELLTENYNSLGHRIYTNLEGKKFPSITTVLSQVHEETINKWKERVGLEEAEKIKEFAAFRGSVIHEMAENYLSNTFDSKKYPTLLRLQFNSFKKYLDEIEEVNHLEIPLYSDYLKVAGRCDCIAKFRGKRTIIDFKTSKRSKSREKIGNYFMQAAGYAVMFEERSGIPIKNLAIVIAIDDDDPQIFCEQRDDWIFELIRYRKLYGERYGEPQ